MADINIERKRGPGMWPWLLGLLALALLIFGITRLTGGRDDAANRGVAGDTVRGGTPAAEYGAAGAAGAAAGADRMRGAGGGQGGVNEYVTFVDERIEGQARAQGGQVDRTGDHETTAEGLRRLAGALDDIAAQNGGGAGQVQQQTGQIREQADQLERSDPNAMHSDMVRQAFDAAVQAFSSLDGAHGGNHAQGLRQTAQRVQPNTPLNNQMDAVREFFRESRDAVRQMSDSAARR